MRNLLLLLSIANVAFWGSACSNASGTLLGDELLYDAGSSALVTGEAGAVSTCPSGIDNTVAQANGGMPRWQDLYPCYFTSCGAAGGTCHSASGDTGASLSGFICGTDATSCWTGITQSSAAGFQALVPKGGTANAAKAPLFGSLRVEQAAAGPLNNNMPLTPVYTFLPQDIASIQTWIQDGAQNN
jgi:hypothetical protein